MANSHFFEAHMQLGLIFHLLGDAANKDPLLVREVPSFKNYDIAYVADPGYSISTLKK